MKRIRRIIFAAAVLAALLTVPTAAFAGLGGQGSPSPVTYQANASSLEASWAQVQDDSWLQIFLGPILTLLSV